jgi:hypothetical protein
MLAPCPITWTGSSSLKMELVEVWKLAHLSPKCFVINLLVTFGNKSNNNLQLCTLVNHEATMFKSFLSKFSTIPKIMN